MVNCLIKKANRKKLMKAKKGKTSFLNVKKIKNKIVQPNKVLKKKTRSQTIHHISYGLNYISQFFQMKIN